MKVYLAAQYPRRDELREHRKVLEAAGIESTSRWLDEQEPLSGNMTHREPAWYTHTAKTDLEDVDRANVVLFFAEDPLVGVPRGGRHVEFGYALGKGKPIHVIGCKENVFHYLEAPFYVLHHETIQDFINAYYEYREYADMYESD
jgi:nucleoside 2-deoxyribosyltransferase